MSGEGDAAAGRAADRLNAFLARNQPPAGESQAFLDAATVDVVDALASQGVNCLLLKGAGLLHLLYRAGEGRSYVDIDLLVDPSATHSTAHVLDRLGYRNLSAARGVDDIGGVVHGSTWLGTARDVDHAIQLDVHRWLPGARAAPEVAWEILWRHRTSIDLAAGRVPVLAREGQALQLAMHVAQHGAEYAKGLRELSLALERWPADVWRAAAQLAAEVDAADTFAAGLRLVPRGAALASVLGLPAPDLVDWHVRHQSERPRGFFHLEAFSSAAGMSERMNVVRRALVPNRQWLAAEYRIGRRGPIGLALAYGLHLLRAPVWAARAWRFGRRADRRNG